MKTEKAIERIKAFRDYLCAGNPIWDVGECKEAFDIAIAAMEQRWMPAADVPDRKVGKWILYDIQDKDESANGNFYYVCSCCGKGDIHAKSAEVPYCWWCGARMDEVEK